MAHKHATEMLQFAQDAAETDTPWDRWESRAENGDGEWETLGNPPRWIDGFEYRRIAKRVSFGGLEWIAPLDEAPEAGTEYWYISSDSEEPIQQSSWDGAAYDSTLFDRGLAFATEEAAREAWAAMQKIFGGAA